MTRILSSHPNRIYTLHYFSELFKSARSTVCEDIAIIRDTLLEFGLGDLESIAGAGGGVRFIPLAQKENTEEYIKSLCSKLSDPDRILPGGYIYMSDILYEPQQLSRIGEILAANFIATMPDFVITVESKGIPVAVMTAFFLGCPVVAAIRDGQITEGPLVSINYVTTSSRQIRTMSLPKRAIKQGSRALIIDDFMKGGGTAQGMVQLLQEFNVEVAGIGVVMATREPQSKLVDNYTSLLVLEEVNEKENHIKLSPSTKIYSN